MVAKVDQTHAALVPPVDAKPAEVTPPDQKPAEAEQKPAEEQAATDEAAKAAESAGLDMASLNTEFATTGTLSEASFEALSKVGIDKATVESYIAGQVALAAQRDTEGFSLVGGKEQFDTMAAWAATNMSDADREAFNASVSGSPAQMKQAVLGLKASYEAAMGSDPSLVRGAGAPSAGVTPYASRAEVVAAMKDSRYQNDPAYRALVEQRIGLMDSF